MEYPNIVCGVTGSAHAQKAALEAAVLAKQHNANLIYVYVVDIDLSQRRYPGLPHQDVEEVDWNVSAITSWNLRSRLALTQGVTPKKIVRRGDRPGSVEEVVVRRKRPISWCWATRSEPFSKRPCSRVMWKTMSRNSSSKPVWK